MAIRISHLVFLLSVVRHGMLASATSPLVSCPAGCHCGFFSMNCCESGQNVLLPIAGVDNVTRLTLSGCAGWAISRQNFGNFSSLEELTITSTLVTYVDAYAFTDFLKLKTLSLRGLNLSTKTIHPSAFNDLPIQQLDLRNNSLTLIQSQMFSGLQNLRELDLSRNKISVIQNLAFESLLQLTVLNLDFNNLKTITPLWFKAFANYSSLRISVEGNNLTKECAFRGAELAENKWFTSSVTPKDLLAPENITVPGCTIPTFHNQYQEIFVKESVSVALRCSASSIPRPTIRWLLPNGLEVASSDRFFATGDGKFNLSRLRAGDSGVYTCVATNSEGSAVAVTRLSVLANFTPAITGSTVAPSTPNKKASFVLLIIFIVVLSLVLFFVLIYILKTVYKLAKKSPAPNFEFTRFVDTPNILQVPENPQPMPHV